MKIIGRGKVEKNLYKELKKYSESGVYPLHMPGHKRNVDGMAGDFLKDAYAIDITEIEGFDNLHDAKGLIKEAQKRAAYLYKSSETHFLVNGSSCGILSAIFSVADKGDKIICARNCHKSVFNGILLNELKPVFVYPEEVFDEKINLGIRKEDIEEAILNNRDAKAVLITSPTYDGVLSDVAGIVEVAHEFNIPVIVDEAHGALLYIEGRSAVINGADIVINSLHKTLPALTSTALIHVNGDIVDRNKLKNYLTIFQTSSPSYVLMASIDYAVDIMLEKGAELYKNHCVRILKVKDSFRKLRNINHINIDDFINNGAFDFDESKVILSTEGTGLYGKDLQDILLRDYKLQVEMAASKYVLIMLTVMDSDEGIERLIEAVNDIDLRISKGEILNTHFEKELADNCLRGRINEVSDMTVYIYPPGIPIVTEGEIVTEDAICKIDEAMKAGLEVKTTKKGH